MTTVAAITGHRPPKLGLSWGGRATADHLLVARFTALFEEHDVGALNVGMALGADLLAARAALLMGIPYHAYVPFTGQERKWPSASQRRWRRACDLAANVSVLADTYSARAFQVRNEAMVDNAELVIAAWDGTSGGTANAVHYAQRQGVPVFNTESLEVTQ